MAPGPTLHVIRTNEPSLRLSDYTRSTTMPGTTGDASDDLNRFFEQLERRLEPPAAAVPDFEDRISPPHLRSRRREDGNPDTVVDDVVELAASGAKGDSRTADSLGLDRCDKAAARRGDRRPIRRRRQKRVVVDDARVAALMFDDVAELLDASARRDRLADASLGVGFCRSDARDDEHARCQQNR